MSDGFSGEVNSVAFEAAMQRLREGVRKGFVEPQYGTLGVQGRLLSERCQTFTPPKNVGQGRAAVMRDLTRIFFPISPSTWTDKGIKKIVASDNRSAWNIVAKNLSPPLKNTVAISFNQKWHNANRVSRGRARGMGGGKKKRAPAANLGVVTLGPEAKKSRAYMKEVLRRVGWAKAGWNAGILGLGGTVKASWISRHGTIRGRLIDGRTDADPFVRIINDTGWAKYGPTRSEAERILTNAIAARARDMEAYVMHMMRVAADRAASR